MTHSVAIIGLGGIGMQYDFNLPDTAYVYSHARAFFQHPGFELVGAIDPDASVREKFTDRFGVPAYPTVAELYLHSSPDVIVVASPTTTHIPIIDELLLLKKPKAILCEKPIAYSAEQAEKVIVKCKEHGVRLFVNYIRRADPAVIEVKRRLDEGLISFPFKAVVWYSKGLIHNGSHFLDLMTFWFGSVKSLKIIDAGRAIGNSDSEPDFIAKFDYGSAVFCAATEENFSHYTIEVIAANGRLRYEQGGKIIWQMSQAHPLLNNYRQLTDSPEVIQDDMNRYQYRVADQLIHALNGDVHHLCEGVEGASNIRLLESMVQGKELHRGT